MKTRTKTNSDFLTLAQGARVAPGSPSPNCLWRWCRIGVKSRSGERVRLEHVRMGGRIFVTREALERFGKALAEADEIYFDRPAPERHPSGTPSRSAARREREIRRAETELAKAGV